MFEKNSRMIKTRGIVLSRRQMEKFRIRKIYNSTGDPEFLSFEDAEIMLGNFIQQGESCLMEVATDYRGLTVISIITFEDIWSRNLFALMNIDYYSGFPDLISLYN